LVGAWDILKSFLVSKEENELEQNREKAYAAFMEETLAWYLYRMCARRFNLQNDMALAIDSQRS
jgi:hypothetical protein